MGRVGLRILENRRQQPERGFLVTCFTVPITNLKVFPIKFTLTDSSTPNS